MPRGHRALGSISTDPTTVSSALGQLSRKTNANAKVKAQGTFARNLERSQQKDETVKDFTQHWINHYLSGKPRTERTNWLSDDDDDEGGDYSGDSEVASYLTAKNHLSEDSDGWLGLGDDPVATEDPLKTPTASTKGKEKEKKPALVARHIPKKSTDTLKQSDFWDFGYDPDAMPTTMADLEASTPTQKEAPEQPPAQTVKDEEQVSTPVTPRPAQTKRQRKKVPWRGKQCIIALPFADRRGQPEYGEPLLTPADVENIFDKYKEDIQTFEQVAAPTQSAVPFPDPGESKKEWEQQKFAVSFPNKATWDAYVNHLQEEKLRALGVLFDEPEPEPAPAAHLPGVSPPIPASSVNSNPANPFSSAFAQTTQQSSGIASLTSPASPFGGMPFGSEQPGYPFLPFQHTPPVQSFTPHNFYNQQGGVSPLTAGTLPNFNPMLGPVSPLTAEDARHFSVSTPVHGSHPLSNEFQPANYEEDDEALQGADYGIEADSETIMSNSVPQMAHPTPRGHRHNLSETLQKGVEQAEYEIDNHEQMSISHWAVPEEEQQFHPDPKSQTQHLQHMFGAHRQNGVEGDEGDDIDTNPSITGASPRPNLAGFQSNHQTHDSTQSFGHKSRTSLSGLNVEAAAFDPAAQFAANNFSFMNDAFQPQSPFTFNNNNNAVVSHNGSNSQHSNANQNQKQTRETSKFKFSASSFNVEAPEFNPTKFQFGAKAAASASAVSESSAAEPKPKIFGDYDDTTPTKKPKSKAIPIVKPDDDKKSNAGDENREQQGPAKRTRHGAESDDGEEQAVFVQPEHTLRSTRDTPSTEVKDEDEGNVSEQSTVPAESVMGESKAWKPFEFKNAEDAAAFSAAHPASPPRGEREKPIPILKSNPSPDKELPPLPDKEEETEASRPQSKGFSLKPDAKPFEFSPAINVQPLPEPEPKKPAAGLMASRYAVLSPPTSPASKPLPAPPAQHESSDKGAEHESPDDVELDAVMRQLNEDESDLGVERQKEARRMVRPDTTELRASSPSIIEEAHATQILRAVPRLTTDNQARSQHLLSPSHAPFDPESPVRNLNNPDFEEHISDWDDDFSPADDIELQHKSRFFDTHVNDIIGGILDDRLVPLEHALTVIQRSVGHLTPGSPTPRHANLIEHSDADDEDEDDEDDGFPYRPRSALDHRERRLEKIKQAVVDALASQSQAQTETPPSPPVDLSGVQNALAELKEIAAARGQDDQAEELKVVIAELKQLAVMNASQDHGRDQRGVVGDAVAEIKQFVAEKIEDGQSGDLQDVVAQLKQLVVMKAEQDKGVELQDTIAQLKQLVVMAADQDRSGELQDMVAQLKQLVVMKAEQEQDKGNELQDTVAQLKHLVVMKAEQEQDKGNELQDTVAQLKHLVVMKAEQDKGNDLHEAIVELKRMAARRAEEDPAADMHDAIAQFKQLIVMKAEQDRTADLDAAIVELKTLAEARKHDDEQARLKEMLAEVIASHPKFNEERDAAARADDEDKFQLQIDGLQSMLRIADERADDEYSARRRTQDSLAESQRRLKIAEEDAARAREESAALKEQVDALKQTRAPDHARAEEDMKAQQSLTLALSELSDKNIALEGTLDSYKVACDRAVGEVEVCKTENKELCRTIGMLKDQLENGLQSRQGLREKFDRLQEDMIRATDNIAQNQSGWRKKEEEQIIRYNALQAQHETEVKRRQKLEMHLTELEEKEKEALKLKYILRQSQDENAQLEELLMNVRQESHDYQNQAARFEREFNEARESSRIEIQRVRTLLEADLDAANHQVNFVRAELEAQLQKLENHLENSRMKADTEIARHELLLDEAKESKAAALRDAADAKEAAVQEQRLADERAMDDLRDRHARDLRNAEEDRGRDESHYMELLALRDEKIEQLQDKILIVEEKLELAKSAARAAAQAAQSAKRENSPAPAPAPTPLPHVTSPSMTFAKGSAVPDRISPQALRESVMVLQDQLQQREGRIEELEHELSLFDKDAPNKIKDKETEITWLRELLGVRIDDLQDIIHILSQPSFNQQAVRDAAIRLKANLQMQQQERERAMTGGAQPFPSLASLSNFAASPRAFPLAAAAAWGNWRKARETSSASRTTSDSQQTPSKAPPPSTAQGFLSGLMTPPSSNARQAPNQSGPSQPGQSRPLRSSPQPRALSIRQMGKMPLMEPPSTPPLLRTSSYDHDAESTSYQYEDAAYADDSGNGNGNYNDDNENDNESLMGGIVSRDHHVAAVDGPFGPAI